MRLAAYFAMAVVLGSLSFISIADNATPPAANGTSADSACSNPQVQADPHALAAEAVSAYEKIRAAFANRDADVDASSLLYDGKPAQRDQRGFYQNVARQRLILQSIAQAKTGYQDFKVTRTSISTVEFQSLQDKNFSSKNVSETSVTFRLEGTETIAKADPALYRQRTRREDGRDDCRLTVLMKKIDGRWYWSPFGW